MLSLASLGQQGRIKHWQSDPIAAAHLYARQAAQGSQWQPLFTLHCRRPQPPGKRTVPCNLAWTIRLFSNSLIASFLLVRPLVARAGTAALDPTEVKITIMS